MLTTEAPNPGFIIDTAHDAIVCNDLHGRITLWNRAAEHLLGYTAAEAIGRDISLLFPPEGQRDEAAALACLERSEGGTVANRILLAKSLQRVNVSIAVSPIRDAKGGCVGASHVCRRTPDSASTVIDPALHLGAIVASSDDVIISKEISIPMIGTKGTHGVRKDLGKSGSVRLMTHTPAHTITKASRVPILTSSPRIEIGITDAKIATKTPTKLDER